MQITKLLARAFSGFAIAIIAACAKSGMVQCDHSLRGEQVSADGAFKAAVLDVACGATTADASWVLITAAKESFKDDRDKAAVFNGPIVKVLWDGNDLVVIYGDARPFKTPGSAKGVNIVYRESE